MTLNEPWPCFQRHTTLWRYKYLTNGYIYGCAIVDVQLPPEFVSSGSSLYVHFKTDDTIFGKGFSALYMQVDSTLLAPTDAQLPPGAAETNAPGFFETRTTRRGKTPSTTTTTKKLPHHHRHHHYHLRHRQQHLRVKTSRFVTWKYVSDEPGYRSAVATPRSKVTANREILLVPFGYHSLSDIS